MIILSHVLLDWLVSWLILHIYLFIFGGGGEYNGAMKKITFTGYQVYQTQYQLKMYLISGFQRILWANKCGEHKVCCSLKITFLTFKTLISGALFCLNLCLRFMRGCMYRFIRYLGCNNFHDFFNTCSCQKLVCLNTYKI